MNWIPCSERMPPDYETVIFCSAGFVRTGDYAPFREGKWFAVNGKIYSAKEVTHWMPLPPPPDAEQRKPASVINPGLSGPSIG